MLQVRDPSEVLPQGRTKISISFPLVFLVFEFRSVKFPYWGVLNYADSLCIKLSAIFYIVNPNPNPAGPSTPQYGN